jgi:glycosyltransferase involved in cell wall biosynthesis
LTSDRSPRLSFCIATRNRARLLRETLESILAQSPEDVEIVVVDGASDDDTPDVVAALQRRYERLRFQRQVVNGGVDADYAEAVSLARGEYCWLMSDDDVLVDGAVQRVMAELASRPFLVVVNGALYDLELQQLLDPSRLGSSSERYEVHQQAELLAGTGFLSHVHRRRCRPSVMRGSRAIRSGTSERASCTSA